ncbi:hypothetical protein N836_07255 [Leptolyngbya sp. Heron Island J]|uniref:CU044_2847 family protein n=1 Tax=Leptolyngbya sp. Heron Island J TaxID=1385935 RepID=UPI0003B986CC|nr:CU044_2847 family protein [Leptolyngbya sp. Heron Island J]ESA36564.1 hypothetical protein N836_07255 [Leptolyngbya sp. Heron Island J]
MSFEEQPTERISMELANGHIVQADVVASGRSDVAFDSKEFKEVTETLGGIIDELSATIHKAMPTKATVKFGIELGLESGQLTAAFVKGNGKADLEISLEWDRTAKVIS